MKHIIVKIASMSAIAFLAACSTPSEVLDLAKVTAANTSLVLTELNGFKESRGEIEELRARNTATLFSRIDSHQAAFDAFLQSAKTSAVISGTEKRPNLGKLIEELRRVAIISDARREELRQVQASVFADITASQEALVLPSESLEVMSTTLGALATSPDSKATLALIKPFLTEVVGAIKDAKEEVDSNGG